MMPNHAAGDRADTNTAHGGMMFDDAIRWGEIYSAALRDCTGADVKKSRPVLVIQNDVGNRYSPSIIIACVTSAAPAGHFPVVVELPNGCVPGLSAICLNQIMMVDRSSLREKIAELSPEIMAGVDEALRVSLGLPRDG
jgi:mRNA interferase MazF